MSKTAASRKIRPWLTAGIFVLAVFLIIGGITGQSRAEAQDSSGTVLATVVLNTIRVVSVSAPVSVAVGEQFQLVATVANSGTTRILKASAKLQVPGSSTTPLAFSFKGNDKKNLGVIQPLNDKSAKWNLTAEEIGCQIIQVAAEGIEQESGELLGDQGTVIVEVGAGACSSPAVLPETIPTTVPKIDPILIPSTPSPEPEPTAAPTSMPSITPEPELTATPTSTATAVPVPEPEPTAIPTPTPSITPEPEPSAAPKSTATSVPDPEPEPTFAPTSTPSISPEPESTVSATAKVLSRNLT